MDERPIMKKYMVIGAFVIKVNAVDEDDARCTGPSAIDA
jgi:hypothetical protein